MKVISITETKKSDQAIEIGVAIEGKKDLILSFQGASELPCVNDSVFLYLYIQSMQEGTSLCFPPECPISNVLVDNMARHQEIFSQWFSDRLSPIDVSVSSVKSTHEPQGVISFFSGGVDSFFTYVEKSDEISHIFLCLGMDIQLHELNKIKLATEQYKNFAEKNNKTLLIVTTNVREVFPEAIRVLQYAAQFSALVLAYGLKKLYIPACMDIKELFPHGSHILTNRLFSNGVTDVVNHGDTTRVAKTVAIAAVQEALDALRICNSSDEFNCGECEKCLRTMFVIGVLNKSTNSLPKIEDKLEHLKKIKIYQEAHEVFWLENYNLALKHNRLELAGYAKNILRSYQWRQWLKKGIRLFKGQ
jgi:hypothetical protein